MFSTFTSCVAKVALKITRNALKFGSLLCFFGPSISVAEESIPALSASVEEMFSTTSTASDRGKVFETVSSVDATSEPCKIVFSEVSTLDGKPFVANNHTIDATRIRIDGLRDVPSYMKDTDPDLLEKMVWLSPTTGTFLQETERFYDDRKLLYGTGGVCDQTSCRESAQVYLHVVSASNPAGYQLVEDLVRACADQ